MQSSEYCLVRELQGTLLERDSSPVMEGGKAGRSDRVEGARRIFQGRPKEKNTEGTPLLFKLPLMTDGEHLYSLPVWSHPVDKE
ncbi:hypothetical protein ATANTOWER_007183, partial [Ataeniobius toweri]|nr:hypothetical protein [Ataeniobius toweri]